MEEIKASMTDINKLIEEEAEKLCNDRFDLKGKNQYGDIYTQGIIAGASFILRQNRWRKFSTDGLPHIREQIACKSSSGRYHLANPISNDGIHWLAENFIEWKPIE